MNVVKVLTKKIPTSCIANCTFIQFSNDLTRAASEHKGFINSTSYWENSYLTNFDSTSSLYTISDWESVEDWNNWLTSNIRNEILNSHKMKFEICRHTILFRRKKYNDTPLL